MDAITHITLGAVAGEIFAGKQIGKRAMLIGGLIHFLPDIDIVAALWLEPADNLLAHRGITHSFFVNVITAGVLGYGLSRIYTSISWKQWSLFCFSMLVLHLLLDACNAYGTAWFEPFHAKRIAFHLIFVADPLFALAPIIGCIILAITAKAFRYRATIARVTLFLPVLVVAYSIYNKIQVVQHAKQMLKQHDHTYHRLLTTPALFNNWLWFIAAETDSGYYIGHYSVLADNAWKPIFVAKNDALLTSYKSRHDVQQLIRFSEGWYVAIQQNDTLTFNDLRFGQTTGWRNANAPFTFYYYLNPPLDNATVMQRGRLSIWNKEMALDLVNFIRGH